MARLIQLSSLVPDTRKFTFSTWFRYQTLPTSDNFNNTEQANGWFNIFSFGSPDIYELFPTAGPGSLNMASGVLIKKDGGGIRIRLMGRPGEGAGTSDGSGFGWRHPAMTAQTHQDINFAGGTAAGGSGDCAEIAINMLFNSDFPSKPKTTPLLEKTWYHLFISVNTDGADSFVTAPLGLSNQTWVVNKKFNVKLNRDDILNGLGHDGGGGVFQQNMINLSYPDFDVFPDQTVTMPAFDISVAGRQVGVPSLASFAAGNDTPICFSDTQVWFGTYIDPTVVVSQGDSDATTITNIDYFISKTGHPVNPAEATAKFGRQTLLLKGDKATFFTNAGSGGSFMKVGTIDNFAPVP